MEVESHEDLTQNASNKTCPCPENGEYPTVEEFYEAFGGYAIALYVSAAIITIILAAEYFYLVRHFFTHVPSTRRVQTLWVNSVYMVVALATVFCIVLPQSSDFVWLFYRVYLGMAMGYFVDLTLAWYGGESEMLRHVGEGNLINYRVRPCCCCLICPKSAPLNRRTIRLFRGAVYQMPYVQSVAIFLVIVLNLSGFLSIGDLSPKSPYLYLTVVILCSFFFGLWGTFMFFDLTHRYELLTDYQYRKKSAMLKTIVILVNIQGFVMDSIGKYEIVKCMPLISSTAMASVIKSILTLCESFVLGTLCFRLYIMDTSHL